MKTLNEETEMAPECNSEMSCPCCGKQIKVSLEPVEAEEESPEEADYEDDTEEEDAPPAKSKKGKVSLAMDFFGKE